MTDLETLLQRLGLQQYLDTFIAEGFETWETVLDIQEADLEALNVRLGHRRKLQRAIAEYRGISSDRPLASPSQETSGGDVNKPDLVSQTPTGSKDTISAGPDAKRKYRRHPKPDEHAPEKPPSAYVLFSNRVREEVKSENLSFTEIARLVGERWQKLDPQQKELFESHASALKETYLLQLVEYKKTDTYKEYAQYLADFKAKHGNQTDSKRPKLELQHTGSSLSTGSFGDLSVLSDTVPPASGHIRGDSIGSVDTPLLSGTSTLQLTTPFPALNTLADPRGTPPGLPRYDKRIHGQTSGHSSISEESSNVRFDHFEPPPRAAYISTMTPPTGTPPLPATRGLRSEYHPASQSWSTRQITHNIAPIGGHGTSSGSPLLSTPSSGWVGEHRRDASFSSVDSRSLQSSVTPQASSSMSMSQLVGQEPLAASSSRILPPLRQVTGTPSSLPFAPFGSPSVPSPSSQFQPSSDATAMRQLTPRGPHNILESEAAGTLATLADQRESPDPTKLARSQSSRR